MMSRFTPRRAHTDAHHRPRIQPAGYRLAPETHEWLTLNTLRYDFHKSFAGCAHRLGERLQSDQAAVNDINVRLHRPEIRGQLLDITIVMDPTISEFHDRSDVREFVFWNRNLQDLVEIVNARLKATSAGQIFPVDIIVARCPNHVANFLQLAFHSRDTHQREGDLSGRPVSMLMFSIIAIIEIDDLAFNETDAAVELIKHDSPKELFELPELRPGFFCHHAPTIPPLEDSAI